MSLKTNPLEARFRAVYCKIMLNIFVDVAIFDRSLPRDTNLTAFKKVWVCTKLSSSIIFAPLLTLPLRNSTVRSRKMSWAKTMAKLAQTKFSSWIPTDATLNQIPTHPTSVTSCWTTYLINTASVSIQFSWRQDSRSCCYKYEANTVVYRKNVYLPYILILGYEKR